MNISTFVDLVKKPEFIQEYPVICFTGPTYPLLFFSLLWKNVTNQSLHAVKKIFSHEPLATTEIKAQATFSFLGEVSIIWFGDISDWDVRQKKDFDAFINTYKGPNSICFFTDSPDGLEIDQAKYIIKLENPITIEQIEQYQSIFFKDSTIINVQYRLLEKIFQQYKRLELETIALLAQYMQLLSSTMIAEFSEHWVKLIVMPERSLFDLSSLLFAKKSHQFFVVWKSISTEYPVVFWLVYWSEQCFRAANFVQLSNRKEFNQAKKIAYRLPFSFIKKDWKLYSYDELIDAHNDLYNFDYQIKNGGSDEILELFYHKFFASKYKQFR